MITACTASIPATMSSDTMHGAAMAAPPATRTGRSPSYSAAPPPAHHQQAPVHVHASSASSLSIALHSLPLRPSTLATLLRCGFQTTDDVRSSRRCGGVSNLAAELGNVDLAHAASIWREVEDASRGASSVSISTEHSGHHGNGNAHLDDASPDAASTAAVPPTHITATNTDSSSSSRGRITAASLLLAPGGGGSSSGASALKSTQKHIITFARSIDALLGGGIALSELTELSGCPGTGKTQLAMQICVDARLPMEYGGVEGEAVYIDCEGSFSCERCLDMADCLVRHVRRSAERRRTRGRDGSVAAVVTAGGAAVGTNDAAAAAAAAGDDDGVLPSWFKPSEILAGIHVVRVHDMAAQTAAVRNLPAFLKARRERGTPVRVVVVDSVAFHYRCHPTESGTSYGGRTKSLTRLAASLSDLAREHDVAVVAVNQMTTKIGTGDVLGSGGPPDTTSYYSRAAEGGYSSSSSSSRLVPALGESWSHSTTTRLLLTQSGVRTGSEDGGSIDVRKCRLVKCPHKAAGEATFQVTGAGIRDVPSTASSTAPRPLHRTNVNSSDDRAANTGIAAMKRQKVQ